MLQRRFLCAARRTARDSSFKSLLRTASPPCLASAIRTLCFVSSKSAFCTASEPCAASTHRTELLSSATSRAFSASVPNCATSLRIATSLLCTNLRTSFSCLLPQRARRTLSLFLFISSSKSCGAKSGHKTYSVQCPHKREKHISDELR